MGIMLDIMYEVQKEVTRQDEKHGRFIGSTTLGQSRLAIACVEDEAKEARDAWRAERTSDTWTSTVTELIQTAACALRAARDIHETRRSR